MHNFNLFFYQNKVNLILKTNYFGLLTYCYSDLNNNQLDFNERKILI